MSARGSPACATCRLKCRKCDKQIPECQRCILRGLKCGGYPPKFKFVDFTSGGQRKPPTRVSSADTNKNVAREATTDATLAIAELRRGCRGSIQTQLPGDFRELNESDMLPPSRGGSMAQLVDLDRLSPTHICFQNAGAFSHHNDDSSVGRELEQNAPRQILSIPCEEVLRSMEPGLEDLRNNFSSKSRCGDSQTGPESDLHTIEISQLLVNQAESASERSNSATSATDVASQRLQEPATSQSSTLSRFHYLSPSPSVISWQVQSAGQNHQEDLSPRSQGNGKNGPILSSDTEDFLSSGRTQSLLSHYDTKLCAILAISQPNLVNPFREHILPLAYEHVGLLHAVLALSSCHLGLIEGSHKLYKIEADGYRLNAIQYLGRLLQEERIGFSLPSHRDAVLALIYLLVMDDICESGISSEGVHLRGAAYMCGRIMADADAMKSRRTVFLLSSLAWLDLMRGISGAEKLSFSQEQRVQITCASGYQFELMCGCPKELFVILGDVVEKGKSHFNGEISTDVFERMLAKRERELVLWNENRDIYPNGDAAWKVLADGFRHASILRILRFPDTFTRSAEFPEVQESVTKILDASSKMQSSSPLYKRLLLPLFMAGADALRPYQHHYVSLQLEEIAAQKGFETTAALLLQKVWDARALQKKGDMSNIPWMEFTCSKHLEKQHDYLIW